MVQLNRVGIALAVIAATVPTLTRGANVFVSGNDQSIREYTTAGVLVRTIPVPVPAGGDAGVRGTVIAEDGTIHVYNGTFDAFVSSYDPVSTAWTHRTHAGFSTVNNGSYGAIATFGQYVYAPDMQTFGGADDQLNGIIRFDTVANTSQRFENIAGAGYGFINLARGLDGLLYALGSGGATEGTFVRVYDPLTMAFVRQVNLAQSVRGVVVDAQGNIYGGSWSGVIYNFGTNGQVIDSISPGGNISDLDLLPDGSIVAGNWFNTTYLTDVTMSNVTTFPIQGDGEFVTWAVPVPEPAAAAWIAMIAMVALKVRRSS